MVGNGLSQSRYTYWVLLPVFNHWQLDGLKCTNPDLFISVGGAHLRLVLLMWQDKAKAGVERAGKVECWGGPDHSFRKHTASPPGTSLPAGPSSRCSVMGFFISCFPHQPQAAPLHPGPSPAGAVSDPYGRTASLLLLSFAGCECYWKKQTPLCILFIDPTATGCSGMGSLFSALHAHAYMSVHQGVCICAYAQIHVGQHEQGADHIVCSGTSHSWRLSI